MSDVTIPEAVKAKAEAISQGLVDHAFKHGKLVNAYLPEFIASAILAERERCAKVCEEQKSGFLSPEYASNQPLGSFLERFACDECAQAIRSSHE